MSVTTLGLIALAIFVTVAIVSGVMMVRRGKESTAPDPTCTLDKAWDHYVGNPGEWSDRDRSAIESLSKLADTQPLRTALGTTLDAALGTPDPQAALRDAVMDATDRFVLGESIGADDAFEGVAEAGVLRCYSKLRYADYSKDDWYAHYLSVAEMNSKNVASMVQKTVRGEQSALEASLHDPLTRTMHQVRKTLLHYPPRTAVVRSDKLAAREETLRLIPTQQQIDQLVSVMSTRFEKLFAGQVYRVENGPAISPSIAFQLDGSLLYTLLSVNFKNPTEPWRQVMTEALGKYREAMDDEKKLLEAAANYRQIWIDNERHGPLSAVLSAVCSDAFTGPVDKDAVVGVMMEDAGPLVGMIRDLIDEKR